MNSNKLVEKKVSATILLMMKAPVILIRQSEVDYVAVVEWYRGKIHGLITEEHTPEDKNVSPCY